MLVQVEMTVGSNAIGLLPVVKGQRYVDVASGEIVKIEKKPNAKDRTIKLDCSMWDDYGNPYIKRFQFPEYRIVQYEFGGVMIANPKFDQRRIEKEDGIKLQGVLVYIP